MPTLALALDMAMRQAVATSLVVVSLVSVTALAGHLVAGSFPERKLTLFLTITASGGALAGASLSTRLPRQLLGQGFAGLVVGVAVYLLLDTLVFGGAAAS